MISKALLIVTIFTLSIFQARAISLTSNSSAHHVPIDSSLDVNGSSNANSSTVNKRTSFFAKIRNKMIVRLAHSFATRQQQSGVKKAFGLASLIFELLAVLALFEVSVPAFGIFFLAGILSGIISLAIRGDKDEKKRNTLALTGIIIGGAIFMVLTVLYIVYSSSSSH